MNAIGKAVSAFALVAVAATAQAGVRAYHARVGNFTSTAVTGVDVPLNAVGATIVTFNLPAGGKKVLTYSAECAVDAAAGNNAAWLDLDIIVNGVVVPVTNQSSDAFCTSDTVVGSYPWTRASITVQIQGITGNNTIRVRARGNNGATELWLGDSALIVHD